MLPFSEACERNKQPILAVLRAAFAGKSQVLEIGSGTGQHAVHFMLLDVNQSVWPELRADAIFTANTLHIMAWAEVQSLFRGLHPVLTADGMLCIYGPFRYGGRYTSESNRDFDRMLRERDPLSGLRDIDDLSSLAERYGLELKQDHDLPANNRLLAFVRAEELQPRLLGPPDRR
jgi:hypothetical protein